MSIYQARRKQSRKQPEQSSGGGDVLQLEGAAPEPAPPQNLAHLRKARPVEYMAAAQTNFDEIFREAFRKAGYEVVTAPGPDVLRVNSSILDLVVNAPKGQDTMGVTWIISAGEAALIVEVRDSATNALLGRVADRRATQDLGRQIASTATNIYDFRLLFSLWAGICTKALEEVKSVSPIPKDLQPNQRL